MIKPLSDEAIRAQTHAPVVLEGHRRLAQEAQKDALRQVYELIEAIIEDWEDMTSREGGEEEWEAKYHCDTSDLDNLIERTLRELAEQ